MARHRRHMEPNGTRSAMVEAVSARSKNLAWIFRRAAQKRHLDAVTLIL